MALPRTTRPWMAHWPEGVPKTVAYPHIPVQGILSRAVKTHGQKIAVVYQGF